jgi:hypothetical protein
VGGCVARSGNFPDAKIGEASTLFPGRSQPNENTPGEGKPRSEVISRW